MYVTFSKASKPKTFTPSKAERDQAMKIAKERSTPQYLKGEIARLEDYARGLSTQRGVSPPRARMLRDQIAVKLKTLKAQLAVAERRIVKPVIARPLIAKPPEKTPAATTATAATKPTPDAYTRQGKPAATPAKPRVQTKA